MEGVERIGGIRPIWKLGEFKASSSRQPFSHVAQARVNSQGVFDFLPVPVWCGRPGLHFYGHSGASLLAERRPSVWTG